MALLSKPSAPSESIEVKLQSTNRDNWEYVTVPEFDYITENAHPTLSINFVVFAPGTHLVPPDIAVELKRLVDDYRKSRLKLLNPRIDTKGVNLSGSMFGGQGVASVDPSHLQ